MSLHVAVSGWLLGPPSGANRRLLALVEHTLPLLADGERITVLHGGDVAPAIAHPRLSWQAVPIPAGGTWRRVLAERRHLAGLVERLRIDVLDHGLLPTPHLPCTVLQTIHDLRQLDGFGTGPRWLLRAAVRRAAARAAAIIVPSSATATAVRAVAPSARVTVVANGTALPPVVAEPPIDAPLLHVGHLEPRKNVAVLLHALARIASARRRDLMLVGTDAGSGGELRALAQQLGIAARTHFVGAVDDATLQRHYATAAAVLVPSRCEGFGLAALEGLAHGRPVLAATAGALPEVLGDQGVLLPADDVAAWAAAIDALPRAAGTVASRRARAAQFSWANAAEVLVAEWRRAVRTRGS